MWDDPIIAEAAVNQAASLDLLAQHGDGELAQRARIVREERFDHDMPEHGRHRLPEALALSDRLETRTFWTELRARPELSAALWHVS